MSTVGDESGPEEYERLVVEDRARKLASAKTEAEVIALIRISVTELETAVERLERFLNKAEGGP